MVGTMPSVLGMTDTYTLLCGHLSGLGIPARGFTIQVGVIQHAHANVIDPDNSGVPALFAKVKFWRRRQNYYARQTFRNLVYLPPQPDRIWYHRFF